MEKHNAELNRCVVTLQWAAPARGVFSCVPLRQCTAEGATVADLTLVDGVNVPGLDAS